MAKSTGIIDYESYIRYLKKVTGESADPHALKYAVFERTVENTEMQNALVLMKILLVAAVIVLICAFGAGGIGYYSSGKVSGDKRDTWYEARKTEVRADAVLRLYHAYEHSKAFRDKL